MRKYFLIFQFLLISFHISAQEFRESITLNGNKFKIYDTTISDSKTETTKYSVVDEKENKIEHLARVFDKKSKAETYLGIYRTNDSEIHFIEFNQTKSPSILNHYVYSPNKSGKLQLTKKELNLIDYPEDLPPKFISNKPIHPEFPGGSKELNKWAEINLKPILQKKLKSQEIKLTLEIDEDGNALPINLSILKLDSKTEEELLLKIKGMPKWETSIQANKVSGLAVIPITLK